MANIKAAFATSHASAFMDPGEWDGFRAKIRSIYGQRYGSTPPEPEQVGFESAAQNVQRYQRIADVHSLIRRRLDEIKPDVVIVLGNDQNENYDGRATPQFAIYTGEEMEVDNHLSNTVHQRRSHPILARALLDSFVADGFDVVQTSRFENDRLRSHAHAQVMAELVQDRDLPVIPIFVNAISPPLPATRRCFEFGKALSRALERTEQNLSVVVATSGGLSHFTAGYPYELLSRPATMGAICESFDREILSWVEAGDLDRIATLTDQSLLDSGNGEFRQSVAFFGAMPQSAQPAALAYEAIYQSLIGMWAGYWEFQHA